MCAPAYPVCVLSMDICVLNQFFHPYSGGTEKVLFEIYKRLAKRNNVTVITSGKPGARRSAEYIEGMDVVRLKTSYVHVPGAPLPFVSMDGLDEAVEEAHCEIYHINNRYQYFHPTVAAIRGVGGRIALTIHNSLPMGIDPVTDAMGYLYDVAWGRRLMHHADVITGVSMYAIRATVPAGEARKAHLVYNGVDYRTFRPGRKGLAAPRSFGEGFSENEANIITNGRFVAQKGQIYLIRAVGELAKEGHKLGLVMIGRGPLEARLAGAARRLGLRNMLWIKTGLSEKRLADYYNACDLFVLPSLYEPAGVAALEALSCELPSIVSDAGGLPEMAGGNALLAAPGDVKDIKEKILYALSNKRKMRAMAKRGRKMAVRRHDWDDIARQYERIFLNTLHY